MKHIQDCIYKMDYKEQWLLFFAINYVFIYKYMSRTAYNPFIGIGLFTIVCAVSISLFRRFFLKNELLTKILLITGIVIIITFIAFILYKIDPVSVNVDRWSATTYFLDGLFSGDYPYGIHTHVSETNYPSPFPLWHYINLPFWLLGDVGIGLVFFLLLIIYTIYKFTRSFGQTLFFFVLLILSPAYWWEVFVRSDGLSNAFLVFCLILLMEKKNISFQNHWLLATIICGLMASTRMSAVLPFAIYLGKSFLNVSISRKIYILTIICIILFFFFLPYIFWDTNTWIFFSRNPFMSQTSTGNGWILCLMAVIAIIMALLYNDFHQYTRYTSCFIILFFMISMVYDHIAYSPEQNIFDDSDFDVSYFSLAFPYILYSIDVIKK